MTDPQTRASLVGQKGSRVAVSVLPYAAGSAYSGGSARRIQLTRAVGQVGDHTLVVLAEVDAATRRDLAEVFDAEVVCAPVRKRSRARALAYWLVHPTVPWSASRTDYSEARACLRATAKTGRPRVIWCNGVQAWPGIPRELRGLAVIDAHDLPSKNQSELLRASMRRWMRRRRQPRQGEALGPPVALKEVLLASDAALRCRLLEQQIARQSRALVLSSEIEAGGLRGSVVVPNGASEPATEPRPASQTRFVFPGQFRYPPNIDGAEWLALEVLPLLRRVMDDPVVVLAGSGSDRLASFAQQHGIDVTGFVQDFDEVYDSATVVVVPLLSGSGTRIKILEAWARGLPVVSTTKGAEGLGAVHGETALLVDTPADFAQACADVAASPELRARLGLRGRQRFELGGSWAQSQAGLLRWLRGAP